MRLQFLISIVIFAQRTFAAVHAFTKSNSESPFWWTFTGTPVLDGIVFYAIVSETPPALSGLTRFYEANKNTNGDYLYTTSYSEYDFIISAAPGSPLYGDGAFDTLYIFADQEPDTVPLYRFWNGQNHFFTTSYDEGTSNGYNLEGVAGYVYLAGNNGAIPIWRWHEDNYQFRPGKK